MVHVEDAVQLDLHLKSQRKTYLVWRRNYTIKLEKLQFIYPSHTCHHTLSVAFTGRSRNSGEHGWIQICTDDRAIQEEKLRQSQHRQPARAC